MVWEDACKFHYMLTQDAFHIDTNDHAKALKGDIQRMSRSTASSFLAASSLAGIDSVVKKRCRLSQSAHGIPKRQPVFGISI
jgi:hypothetical protein